MGLLLVSILCSGGCFTVNALATLSTEKDMSFIVYGPPFLTRSGDLKAQDFPFIPDVAHSKERYVPPSEPVSVDETIVTLIERLDEELILHYLEALTSFGPRVTMTDACERSGDYLYNEFVSMGLPAQKLSWDVGSYSDYNIEATHRGDGSTNDEFIICAHYDSVEDSPGADDDGSGVAAVMAAAHLMRNYHFTYTITFVAFSGEEQGLLGSRCYVEDAVANNIPIAGVLNLDMIGYADTDDDTRYLTIYQDTNNPLEWISNYTLSVAEAYYEYLHLTLVPSGFSWGSDHYWFWKKGYSAIYFEESHFNDYYHSPEDTIEHMDLSYEVNNAKLIMATLAELADIGEYQAPLKPVITNGTSQGAAREAYNYSACATDPQHDGLFFLWDFGDSSEPEWIGPYASGMKCTVSHTWEKKGDYVVRVQAKDEMGHVSDWSDPLAISMPQTNIFGHPFLERLERFTLLQSFFGR